VRVRRYFSSDGVHLAYEEWTGSGPTLVFCHGLAATGEQFADDAAFFAARGHHVLVPHLRGHGLSEGPAVPTAESLSIPRLAADLVDMLDHAGASRVHWVGNSLGGIVALQMLASRRFHSLATFGTTYAIRLPRLGGHRLIGAAHRMVGAGRMAALTARLTSRHADARRLIEKMLRDVRIETAERLAGILTQYDLTAAGSAADIPILLLRAPDDRAVNAGLGETLRIMRARPRFRLVDLPMGGHVANLDGRDGFRAALIEFWASLPG